MLAKDVIQRTESDMKELRNILMQLDFIKNGEQKLAPVDLADFVKSVQLHKFEAG